MLDPVAHDLYAGVSKGAYVLEDVSDPQVVLIAPVPRLRSAGSRAVTGGDGIRGARSELSELEDLRRATAEYKASVFRQACPNWRWRPERRRDGGSMWERTET